MGPRGGDEINFIHGGKNMAGRFTRTASIIMVNILPSETIWDWIFRLKRQFYLRLILPRRRRFPT